MRRTLPLFALLVLWASVASAAARGGAPTAGGQQLDPTEAELRRVQADIQQVKKEADKQHAREISNLLSDLDATAQKLSEANAAAESMPIRTNQAVTQQELQDARAHYNDAQKGAQDDLKAELADDAAHTESTTQEEVGDLSADAQQEKEQIAKEKAEAAAAGETDPSAIDQRRMHMNRERRLAEEAYEEAILPVEHAYEATVVPRWDRVQAKVEELERAQLAGMDECMGGNSCSQDPTVPDPATTSPPTTTEAPGNGMQGEQKQEQQTTPAPSGDAKPARTVVQLDSASPASSLAWHSSVPNTVFQLRPGRSGALQFVYHAVPPPAPQPSIFRAAVFGRSNGVSTMNVDWSPNKLPHATLEMLVLLRSQQHDCGWIATTTPRKAAVPRGRGVALYDKRYGAGKMAVETGSVYESTVDTPPVGRWAHVVAVYRQSSRSSGTATLYVNHGSPTGGQQQTVHITRSLSAMPFLNMGGFQNGECATFAEVAYVRLYDQALTADAVEQLYKHSSPLKNASTPATEWTAERAELIRWNAAEGSRSANPWESADGRVKFVSTSSASVLPHWILHPHNLKCAFRSVQLGGTDRIFRADGLDLSPTALPQLSIEAYVRLLGVDNTRGFLIGEDTSATTDFRTRAIYLHDFRLGGATKSGAVGVGAGVAYNSQFPTKAGRWMHVVATWNQATNTAVLYVNYDGKACKSACAQTISTQLVAGATSGAALLGGVPQETGSAVRAEIAYIRIYNRELSAEAVAANYKRGGPCGDAPHTKASHPVPAVHFSSHHRRSPWTTTDSKLSALPDTPRLKFTGFTAYLPHLRGKRQSCRFHGAQFGGLNGESKVKTVDYDMSPSTRVQLSIEVLIKLRTLPPAGSNNAGWLFYQAPTAAGAPLTSTRGLALHNMPQRTMQYATGNTSAVAPAPAVGRFTHIVLTYSQNGPGAEGVARLYINHGYKGRTVYTAATQHSDGLPQFVLGGVGGATSASGPDVDLIYFRIYESELDEDQVVDRYKHRLPCQA